MHEVKSELLESVSRRSRKGYVASVEITPLENVLSEDIATLIGDIAIRDSLKED